MLEGFINIFTNPLALPLMACGVAFGIILGAMPGFGCTLGVALILPFTFGMDPKVALPMLAAIYAGAMYGGSITAILLGIPGTSSNAATMLDGFPMAQRGESKKALALSVWSSSMGGAFAGICLLCFAPLIAHFTLWFGPAEYFVLAIFGLSIIASVSGGSIVRGLIAGLLGVVLSLIGIDPITGEDRFTFGEMYLVDGFPLIPIILALFAFPRSLQMIRESLIQRKEEKNARKIEEFAMGPALKMVELLKIWKLWLRSSILGTLIGMIPAAGGNVACWVGYSEARRKSKYPEKFGTGVPEGIVGPEAANNATEGGAFIPMLTLSIPGSPPAAIMIGALMIHGLVPGPALFSKYAEITYTFMWGVVLANVLMLIIGLYGAVHFARVARVSPNILAPIILFLTLLGAFSSRQLFFDMGVTVVLGSVFYLLTLAKYPMPPILLGFILGPIAERGLRRALLISHDDWSIFITRPICAVLIVLAILSFYAGLKIMKQAPVGLEKARGD